MSKNATITKTKNIVDEGTFWLLVIISDIKYRYKMKGTVNKECSLNIFHASLNKFFIKLLYHNFVPVQTDIILHDGLPRVQFLSSLTNVDWLLIVYSVEVQLMLLVKHFLF